MNDKQTGPAPANALSVALQALQRYGILFLIAGLLALAAAGAWYAIGRTFDGWVRWLLVGGLAAVAIYVMLRPQDLERVFTGRSARYGSNAVLLSIAAIGIVVLLNYLSTRYYTRFDTTEDKLHSLSPQSLQILQDLEGEIELIGVYPSGRNQDTFESWIDEYRSHTDKLSYRYIDPIRQPGEADQLGWNAYGGGLIVRRGTRSQQVITADEQDITSALLKVSRDTQKVIYWLTGHNEHETSGYDARSYAQVGALLEHNNYLVAPLNLAVIDAVPADAALVVVAGPQSQILDQEQERLQQYLRAGGKALIMVDPGPDTGINDLLAPWQTRIENMVVVDTRLSLSGDPLTPVVDRYRFSQITKDLPMVALPLAAPIVYQDTGQADLTFTSLGETSAQAWAEADLENLDQARYDEGHDLIGPLTTIATLEAGAQDTEERTRLVLIGDSDLLVDEVLNQIPNGQFLFLNAVNWLAEEELLIAIGPKSNVPRTVNLTMVQEGAICLGTLIVIPLVIVAAGVTVWLRRR